MGELALGLREGLADRYAVERELGRGGMATVYLARDLRHERPVALKVLHPELSASMGAERFLREVRLAARLQHPHILTVLDSGEIAVPGAPPLLWFTMPFIRGESLRDRLNRETQLPVEDALRIAREAADALSFAHQEGIIHRDIKPENILLSGTHALVADFGIARALGAGDEKLTETGLAIGTPAYMSPEQASGQRELDPRTDIYSLGVVLYEMLAGETPFAAPTAQAMISRRFMEVARPVRQLREATPEAVEQALQRALSRTAADRFPTAAQFAAALIGPAVTAPAVNAPAVTSAAATTAPPSPDTPRALPQAAPKARRRIPIAAGSLALGFVLGLGLLFGWLRRHGSESPGSGDAKLLAVLPFESLGGGDDEYFADGVTDEVRGKLAALPGLQVTARSSSNLYKKTTKSPQEIGRELGVDYLLTGTVRWEKGAAGNHVRVSPELIQVSSGSTKWQQPFDAALTDVFQVQADVAGQVAQALDLALGTPQRAVLAEKPTANGSAYDAYLKGEAISQGLGSVDPLALRAAIGFYEQAVALDSGFAQAWAQLSRAHSLIYANGTPSPQSERRAREAAERALRLAPNHPAGHLALGDYFASISPDPDRARQAYEAGLRVAPSNADLLGASALVEISTGKWTEALAHFTRAQALDPRSVTISRRLAYTLIRLRRYPEAMAACDRSLALAPNNAPVLENKAMAYLAQGDLEGARRFIRDHSAGVDPTVLAASFGNYFDLYWVLEPDLQNLLLRLTPSAFDDRAAWAIVLAQTYRLQGDPARTRAYADSARLGFEARLRDAPADPQSHVFRGLALAYLGRKAEAIEEGEKGLALLPMTKDTYTGPYVQHQLVRIYIEVGEPDKAMDRLEPLLRMPYNLSPGWLRVDPTFDPLRKLPRFQKLVENPA
jgi:serine/threonine protein kinase/TolB-like protein/Tfp pilus assembly protein PilF